MTSPLSGSLRWRSLALLLCVAILAQLLPVHTLPAAAAPLTQGSGACQLYPIALHAGALVGKNAGDQINVFTGAGRGNFGWLTWTGDMSAAALARSLTPPGDSGAYINPADSADRTLTIGDRVRGRPGSADDQAVGAALAQLVGREIVVPVWDQAAGAGANATYRVDSFARVRLASYQLQGTQQLAAQLLGLAGCGSEPVAESLAATTAEDTAVSLTLRGSHPSPAPLTFQLGSPANGALGALAAPVCTTNGGVTTCTATVTYSPAADFNGSDSFSYTASGGRLESQPATVALTVSPTNDRPVARDDQAALDEDGELSIDVLANDGDIDGDTLAVQLLIAPANGTATVNAAGSISFRPAANYAGGDSLVYGVDDGKGGTAAATVFVSVAGVNDLPEPAASPAALALDEDATASLSLGGTDVETPAENLSIAVVALPQHGMLTGTNGAQVTATDVFVGGATLSYAPAPNYSGADSFTIAATDADGATVELAVPVSVRPVDDAPVVEPRKIEGMRPGAQQSVQLVGSDVDSAQLAFAAVDAPAFGALGPIGAVTCSAEGAGSRCVAEVSYTASAGYAGADQFTYSANDGAQAATPATVSVEVTNAAPSAQAQSVSVAEDTALPLTLAGSDPDGDALSFALAGAPAHGALTLETTTGQAVYTPEANYHGPDSFSFSVNDGLAGAEATIAISVSPVNDAPAFSSASANLAQIIDEGQGLAALSASDPDGDALSFALAGGALPAGITLQADGSFAGAASNSAAGSYDVIVAVSDGNGGNATVTLAIVVNNVGPQLPPDPTSVAPAPAPGVVTDIAAATEFLYTGSNPIQTGVAPGTIQPARVAVLRGAVTGRDGAPLPGVTVSVKGHPEFGQTLTRADGRFDLAVNGGGRLTLDYVLDGFLPAQRQVEAPWRDYAALPSVVLVTLDGKVTAVEPGAATMQVAQGSPVSDADGSRQATLLFPAGLTATMLLSDGTEQTLPALHVRATEYTVGESGPRAMPGELPTASAYTYAVELSVDEAIAAGASTVRFSQPVINYVENFLGFPVGGSVPAGYYDRALAAWVPAPNGRVVKILAVSAGKATLDIAGSGAPATASELAALGVSDAELSRLAELYPAGASLWRVPVEHFTPWDYNWPYGLPDGAVAPDAAPSSESPDPFECRCPGSIIGTVNQTLGEAVPVAGTPFSLRYSSDRDSGYKVDTIEIPLSGATLPEVVKGIVTEVRVAGRVFHSSHQAAPNQSHTFVWDGKDAYGRVVSGRQPALVRVGYVYNLVYRTPAAFARSFALGGGAIYDGMRFRSSLTVWVEWPTSIGAWSDDSQGLGGWGLDARHVYDPAGRTLLLGDGSRRSAETIGNYVINTVAGGGIYAMNEGDQATKVVVEPTDVEVAPDGTLYLVFKQGNKVLKVLADGSIHTVAALGLPVSIAFGPDGRLYIGTQTKVQRLEANGSLTTIAGGGNTESNYIQATQAKLSDVMDIAFGPDGSLYIADRYGAFKVRRLLASGYLTTVAGGGTVYPQGGEQATKVHIGPNDIALDEQGNLFIADAEARRVFVVGAGGTIEVFAGSGEQGFDGDGGRAVLAKLRNPTGVAVASDGSVFISDQFNTRVRRVSPDGIIATVVGKTSDSTGRLFDGGPATAAQIANPTNLAIGPDQTLYINDMGNHRVRAVRPMLGGYVVGDTLIADESGAEVFRFDSGGRHLATLDALTGKAIYSFAYDLKGRLRSITDADANVTTLTYDENTGAAMITAPGGQQTHLTLDAERRLSTIAAAGRQPVTLTYNEAGLLASFTDERGQTSSFTYDDRGRLVKDEGPDGSVTTLARTETEAGYSVSRATALGSVTTYSVERLATGEQRYAVTAPSGGETSFPVKPDGSVAAVFPDGTVVETTAGPDPRWGMQAPVSSAVTVRTPDGRVRTTTMVRTAELSNATNPFSVTRLTETSTEGGRATRASFTPAQRLLTVTTPAGRTVTTRFDTQGRVAEQQLGGLLPISYSYDAKGRVVAVTQGARAWSFEYDAAGQLARFTNPLKQSVQLAYNAAGQLVTQTLPNGQVIGYDYDAAGRMSSLTPPGRDAHSFAYTPVGLIAEHNTPDLGTGRAATGFTYDRDWRVTLIDRPGATISLSYDDAGHLASVNLPNQETQTYSYDEIDQTLTAIVSPAGALAFTYDGALVTGQSWTGTVAGQVGRTFNNRLLVESESVNGAHAASFAYDDDGFLTRAGALTLTRHAGSGLPSGSTLGAVKTATTYTSYGDQLSLAASYNSTSLYSVAYARDALGRTTALTETVAGQTRTYAFTYDAVGQLTAVARDGAPYASYTYDANGNRLTSAVGGASVAAAYDGRDRLTSWGDATYSYSEAGFLTASSAGGQNTAFSYDALGRLRGVALAGGPAIEYLVDGLGRRIGKLVGGSLSQGFLYGDTLRPLAELDGAGNVVSRFVYGVEPNVPAYMVKNGATYRIVTDQLGSPRLVIDTTTGAVVQRLEYDVWGRVLVDTNPGFQPFGFAGGLYDRDTGLVHFGARDYDPAVGRWTSPDPIGFGGGQSNLYVYVGNDPVNGADPSGLAKWSQAKETWDRWNKKLTDLSAPYERYTTYIPAQIQELVLNVVTGWNYGAVKEAIDPWKGRLEKAKKVVDTAFKLREIICEPEGPRQAAKILDAGLDWMPGLRLDIVAGPAQTVLNQGVTNVDAYFFTMNRRLQEIDQNM